VKKSCRTCIYWTGRNPVQAKSWADVRSCARAADCVLDGEGHWQDAELNCSDYKMLPGSPIGEDAGSLSLKTASDAILIEGNGHADDSEVGSGCFSETNACEDMDLVRVLISVAPEIGSVPLRYRITGIECESLPFLEDELLGALELRKERESRKHALCDFAKQKIDSFLESYGFGASVNVEMVMSILDDPKSKHNDSLRESEMAGEAPQKNSQNSGCHLSADSQASRKSNARSKGDRKICTADLKKKNSRKAEYPEDKCINLFVDLGSTNSKYVVAKADLAGKSLAFVEIPEAVKTKRLCGDWGIDYDKTSAYKLSRSEFVSWLSYAVLGFMLKMQKQRMSNVINIYWSFPKLIGSDDLDFNDISSTVTNQLKDYGLRGAFMLVPEAESLKWMFKDRVAELAKASEEEELENVRRSKEEASNRKHNESEEMKVEASQRAREMEAENWKKEHWFKRVFCDPVVNTPLYTAQLKNVDLGRRTLMKAFRKTGATGDGKFNMVILDAGGSTLDFCYLPTTGRTVTESYQAGGASVTELLASKLGLSKEVAESRKMNLACLERSDLLREVTQAVYGNALSDMANKVGHSRPLCVVATGLAMANYQLRLCVKEALGLKIDQMIMYSPDIARLFPRNLLSAYPDFQRFIHIVNRVVEGSNEDAALPWPGGDVCGGMYFKSIAERRS